MKKIMIVLSCLFFIVCLTACEQEVVDRSKLFDVYYVSKAETKVEIHEYVMESDTPDNQLKELLSRLALEPEKQEYKAPLSMGFSLLDYEVNDGKIRLYVDESYNELSPTTEVLVRAAIVKTLTQLEHIYFVGISVDGTSLYDSLGQVVGWMNSEQFINNPDSEINSYEEVRLKLYYATENGDELVEVTHVKPYNGNISMEKLVLEELIKGTSKEGAYPTINPDTRLNSVMTKDGVCYVNLDDNFQNQINDVTVDVAIYSIVNSLAELSNVNKVRIIINGKSTGTHWEKYDVSTVFERNLDIVAVPDE